MATNPRAAEKAAEGSPEDPSGKNDRRPACQEVFIMKEHTDLKLPDTVSTEDTSLALCIKIESEIEIAQCTKGARLENVNPGTADTSAPQALFEIAPPEVDFFSKPMYKARIGIVVNRSSLY